MSYDFIVYTNRAKLPDEASLARHLAASTSRVVLKDGLTWSGFLPVLLDSKDTGFELHASPITENDRRDYLEDLQESGEQDTAFLNILTTSDYQVTVSCTDDTSRAAGSVFAAAVASLAGGYLCDPQTGSIEHAA